jgi:hypothetical protein
MPRVSIPKGADLRASAPSGEYKHSATGAKISKSEIATLPGKDKNTGEPRTGTWLKLSVMFRNSDGIVCFAETAPFMKYNTAMAKGSGSLAPKFVRQLGHDPDDFDTDDLLDMPVDFTTKYEEQEYQGETRVKNIITDIYKAS